MQPHLPTIPQPGATGMEPSIPELSDDALSAAGMLKVAAFVRSDPTAQAKRTKKHRKKSAEAGLRQVNVVAPESAHPAIKAIAEQLRAGCDVRTALEHVLASGVGSTDKPFRLVPPRRKVAGWRRLRIRLMGFGDFVRAIARRLKRRS